MEEIDKILLESQRSRERVKKQAAIFSVILATFLMALKLFYSNSTASLSLLASGIDSLFDIIASLINFYAIYEAAKPADKEHQYGHGKVESLASLFQSTVIIISGMFIFYQGILSALNGTAIHDVGSDVVVMMISTLLSVFITCHLRYIGKKYNSNILLTDSLHYLTDIYQNGGILIAMVLIYFTGFTFFDTVAAILISSYIIVCAAKIFFKSINCLMDRSLPEEVNNAIKTVILAQKDVKGLHMLRTRFAGNMIFIDVHIVLTPHITLAQAHIISEAVENALIERFRGAQVLIHPDPYDDSKENKYKVAHSMK